MRASGPKKRGSSATERDHKGLRDNAIAGNVKTPSGTSSKKRSMRRSKKVICAQEAGPPCNDIKGMVPVSHPPKRKGK